MLAVVLRNFSFKKFYFKIWAWKLKWLKNWNFESALVGKYFCEFCTLRSVEKGRDAKAAVSAWMLALGSPNPPPPHPAWTLCDGIHPHEWTVTRGIRIIAGSLSPPDSELGPEARNYVVLLLASWEQGASMRLTLNRCIISIRLKV